jgi:hypothetical protein
MSVRDIAVAVPFNVWRTSMSPDARRTRVCIRRAW